MSNKKLQIFKVKDEADNFFITPKNDILCSLPPRLILNGRSMLSGKTNFLCNYLLLPEFMGDYYQGDQIFLVSESIETDNKLQHIINIKEIPMTNLFLTYSDDVIAEICERVENDYKEKVEAGETPKQYLLILDDCGHIKDTKKSDILNGVFTKMRHSLLGVMVLLQRFTQASTAMRSNSSGFVLFTGMTNKELDLVAEDVNFLQSKKQFIKMYRDNTKEKYSFIYINIGNPIDKLYLNSNFEPIDPTPYE